MSEVLCLKWNNHKSIFLQNLSSLRTQQNPIFLKLKYTELYSDATLACNGKYFSVHRLVLSTCSEYFEEMFEKMNRQNVHPFIIVTNIEYSYLEALLNFMYNGEVNVLHEMLPGLMKAAEILKIKGLAVPDEETSEKELSNVHERDGNLSAFDISGCHPKSPVKYTSPTKNQLVDENLEPLQNHCSFEDGNTQSEILPSNIETNKSIDTCRFQTKEEFFEMYSLESNKEAMNSSSDSINYQNNIVESRNTQNEIKVEHEFVEQKVMQIPSTSSSIFSEHIPQQLTSNVTLMQPTLSQSFINSDEHISYCRSTEEVECEKEAGIEFEIDQPNDKRSTSVASHSSPVSKKCPKCPYVTKYVSTLRRHIMFKHTGEKPHQCHFCPYRSAHNFNMKKHMMIHTGEKPFSCPLCSYKASQNSNIKAHMKCHEKNQ
ncbi:Protein tramtrack, alpha isoform [Armadillidium nasatum]|uniref:Protein tramtrack, alpha isoform n=1 Tax=Armadillidium nasatum TaxID=96803 RepID=A0A5N5SN45_9CRUS|nr:Protein tramtrack, alpha isoform [Armadillidium nasatum]